MEASQINIFNDTKDGITQNLAIFQKAAYTPVGQSIVAWRTNLPRVGQKTFIPIPANYAVQVIYENDGGLRVATAPAPIIDYSGRYLVSKTEGQITVAQTGPASEGYRVEIEVDGGVQQKVEIRITLGGDLLYPFVIAYPTIRVMYAMKPIFYAAFISMTTPKGAILEESEVSPSAIPIRPGETVYITGNKSEGYRLSARNMV